ncbi:hypothetical protein CALCODRAFT_76705 [Calocera cornea HHB12733]|uniref:Uncharacterized protein n=1 Tax=Calocera cornea HHB12733 TaxID=1353952 RepID=A0A165DI13_9BASI|nr:hypothetical protein CALCODRAFT_76705 [Calocera cornea HHB12733]
MRMQPSFLPPEVAARDRTHPLASRWDSRPAHVPSPFPLRPSPVALRTLSTHICIHVHKCTNVHVHRTPTPTPARPPRCCRPTPPPSSPARPPRCCRPTPPPSSPARRLDHFNFNFDLAQLIKPKAPRPC